MHLFSPFPILQMMRTLIVGSIAFDRYFRYEGSFLKGISLSSLQQLSVSFRMRSTSKCYGGNGLNVASFMRALDGEPLLVSAIGDDGEEILRAFNEANIDTSCVRQVDNLPTAAATIATDDEQRHITFYYPGADDERRWADLNGNDVDCAFIGPSQAGITMQALEWCERRSIPCVFDPGQQTLALRDDELWKAMQFCTGLVANSYEWGMIASRLKITPEELLQDSIFGEDMDPSISFIVITNGGDGFTLYEGGKKRSFPACKSRVISAAPAGDAFHAGMLIGLKRKWPLETSCKFGAAVAACAMEQRYTLPSTFDHKELRRRVSETYSEELPSF